MSVLYVTENGSSIGLNGGELVIRGQGGTPHSLPKGNVDSILLFGRTEITAPVTQYCLSNGVQVSYFSHGGKYFGTLVSDANVSAIRLKKQVHLSENDEFCLDFSKKIIEAKIANQLVILRRYLGRTDEENELLCRLKSMRYKVRYAKSIRQLMGFEGISARIYFETFGKIVGQIYGFTKRTRRPAKDPVNAMLNFGYSMLYHEMTGELTNRGLNAYIGFMHEDKAGHAALSSDLMEEWRPVLVDSTVLSLVVGNEIHPSQFVITKSECTMSTEAMRIFIAKMEQKMHTYMQYLDYVSKPVEFRLALWHQANRLAQCVDENTTEYYHPIRIR